MRIEIVLNRLAQIFALFPAARSIRAMMRRNVAGVLLPLLLLTGGADAAESKAPPAAVINPAVVERLKSHMPPLDLTREFRPLPPDMRTFFEAYGLYHPQVRNFFGRVEAATMGITAYVFVPPAVQGTIYCLHGYFDHVGILRHLVSACLERHYAVAAFDLPGHGLSSGDPSVIDDFAEYAAVLEEFFRKSRTQLPQPYYLVAHSTGGAIGLEFMYTRAVQADRFEKFVLAAPLVRHAYYRISRMQMFLLKPFFKSVPRRFHANSHDADFVERIKHDPLQGQRVPLSWLSALYRWNDRFVAYAPCSRPVLVIQGTDDDVLDWRYNIDLLQEKMTAGRIRLIAGARHQLFNEEATLRRQVLNGVFSFIAQ